MPDHVPPVPRPYHRGITRDTVIGIGLGLAAEDLPLTVTAVARRLDVRVSSIYSHVGGNTELLELVLGEVHEQLAFQVNPSNRWQNEVRGVAWKQRNLLKRYPGLIPVIARRPIPNDSLITSLENLVILLSHAGFTRQTALSMLGMIDLLVIGGSLDAGAPQEMFPDFSADPSEFGTSTAAINDTPDRADALFTFALDTCIAGFERHINL